MAQTKEGAKRARQTMIAKHGSVEAWRAHMQNIASKGGKNGTGHEFAHGRLDPVKTGGLRWKRRSNG